MDNNEEQAAIDLVDFCFIAVGAAWPPLLLLAMAQWLFRRNPLAIQWTKNQSRWIIDRTQELLPEEARRIPGQLSGQVIINRDTVSDTVSQSGQLQQDIVEYLAGRWHVFLVGYTRGGKTVLLHSIARNRAAAGASVMVCDADAITGRYPGYRCVGAGDNYDTIGAAINLLWRETEKRRKQRAAGQRRFPELWFLCDEVHDVKAEIEGAWVVLESVIRRGAKLNMHVVIATQDDQVETLGLHGKSKLLKNLTKAEAMLDEAGRRIAVVGKGVTWEVPDLPNPDDTVTRTSQTGLTGQTATKKQGGQTTIDPLLTELLHGGLRQSEASDHTRPPDRSGPVQTGLIDQGDRSDRPGRPLPDQSEIRKKYYEIGSKNKVWQWLRGYESMGKGRAYDIINAALGSDF